MNQKITIINDKRLRGVIAPASAISESMLGDFVDFFELSTPEEITKENHLIEEADRKNSWIPFKPKKHKRRSR